MKSLSWKYDTLTIYFLYFQDKPKKQTMCSRIHKWFYDRFGEYIEDFRFQPEENTVETEEPLSARR